MYDMFQVPVSLSQFFAGLMWFKLSDWQKRVFAGKVTDYTLSNDENIFTFVSVSLTQSGC